MSDKPLDLEPIKARIANAYRNVPDGELWVAVAPHMEALVAEVEWLRGRTREVEIADLEVALGKADDVNSVLERALRSVESERDAAADDAKAWEGMCRDAEGARDAARARAEKLREALRIHGTCRCDMELSSGLRVATPCGRCAALATDDAATGAPDE